MEIVYLLESNGLHKPRTTQKLVSIEHSMHSHCRQEIKKPMEWVQFIAHQ